MPDMLERAASLLLSGLEILKDDLLTAAEHLRAAPTSEYVAGWLACQKKAAAHCDGRSAGHTPASAAGLEATKCANAIRALAPPSVPSATDANGVWVPPNLYKAACALDALIHSTPDMSGDLRDVRLTGGPKKISDAVRAFKWALTEPPAPSVNEDRMLLLKALATAKASIYFAHGPGIYIGHGPITWIALDAEDFPILTDDLRAALIKATEAK